MSDILAVTYRGGRLVNQSDSQDDIQGPYVALEATVTAGLVKVTAIDGTIFQCYLVLGVVKTLAVKRVWVSGTSAAGIIGYYPESQAP